VTLIVRVKASIGWAGENTVSPGACGLTWTVSGSSRTIVANQQVQTVTPHNITQKNSCMHLVHQRQSRHQSDRGSSNHGSTLLSKRVKAQTRSQVRVRTNRPAPWRMQVEARR
jgi:hypothetical protein